MLRKHGKQPDKQYGEFWHKEHERLQQLNRQAGSAETAVDSADASSSPRAQEQALFIPMTWLTKREREYYKASDPEWQAFVALDKRKQNAAKTKLSELVCKSLSHDVKATRITGTPLKVHAYWLEFQFPPLAPIEYERSGILWTRDRIMWTTRKFDERQTKRFNRVLFPTALFSSLQVLSSKILTSQYESLKGIWSRLGEVEQQTSAQKPVLEPLSPAKHSDGSNGESTLGTQTQSTVSPKGQSLAAITIFQTELKRNTMPGLESQSAILAASKAFLQSWRASHFYFPRGACVLKGEIGIMGPKGRCKMSVTAVYLPKEDTFIHVLGTSVHIQTHKQAPVGKSKPETPSKT